MTVMSHAFQKSKKRGSIIVGLCVGAAMGLVTPAQADMLDDYITMTTGTFDTLAQAERDSRYDHAIWHMVEIWPERSDGRWVYTENWMAEAEKPYRQRITQYTLDDDGGITSQGFVIPNADTYVGAAQDLALLQGLSPDDLSASGSCPTFIARTGSERFESSTVGHSCKNTYKGASYMVSKSVMEKDTFTNWDRGFNGDADLVWGPGAGGYQFVRSESAK